MRKANLKIKPLGLDLGTAKDIGRKLEPEYYL